eukprot:g33588.t1
MHPHLAAPGTFMSKGLRHKSTTFLPYQNNSFHLSGKHNILLIMLDHSKTPPQFGHPQVGCPECKTPPQSVLLITNTIPSRYPSVWSYFGLLSTMVVLQATIVLLVIVSSSSGTHGGGAGGP